MAESMSNGFITLQRKILDWEWYTDTNTTRLFIHLILMANHKDNKYRGTVVKRGELLTSYELLNIQTGLSRQNLRTSLKKLISTDDITIDSTNKGTRLSVCNYDSYQTKKDLPNHQPNLPLTNGQPTTNQPLTTNNNDNNLNNENNRESSAPTRDYLSELTFKTKQSSLQLKMKDSDYQEFLFYWMTPSEYDGLPRWYKAEFFDGLSKIKNWLNGVEAKAEETEVEKYMRKLREADNDK